MHMADALISPAVAGGMWCVSAVTIAGCSGALKRRLDDRKVPLMGVLGAFLFAAQMINFSIPGTGSSGHLGGGLLLAILLGPCAAFLTIASVLVVQALFFADGGLLALGCNIFNMGFIPAFLVYPLCYRRLIGKEPGRLRLGTVIMVSALIGLQLGPFAVVVETCLSGISSLPFATFLFLMQPIHLAIGAVEGVVTVAVVSFVRKARPELLGEVLPAREPGRAPLGRLLSALLIAALLAAGGLSLVSSRKPDGLEWAIAKVTGKTELPEAVSGMHGALAAFQAKSARFPGYTLGTSPNASTAPVPLETGIAGITGTLLVLLLAFGLGWLLKRKKQGACPDAGGP